MVAKAWIENGVVVNLTNADSLAVGDVDGTGAAIGDSWDGQVFSKPVHAVVVPQFVEMTQARLALLQAGLLDDVDAAVTAMGGAVKIEWEYRLTIRRDNPLVLAVKNALGWSDQQMDDLFILAGSF